MHYILPLPGSPWMRFGSVFQQFQRSVFQSPSPQHSHLHAVLSAGGEAPGDRPGDHPRRPFLMLVISRLLTAGRTGRGGGTVQSESGGPGRPGDAGPERLGGGGGGGEEMR